jgi:hypothetical protein
VNAPLLARDGGIEVKDNKTSRVAEYTTLITLQVADKDGAEVVVAGTLRQITAALVRWAPQLDAHARLDSRADVNRPGVIGRIGSILGDSQIGISRIQMGLDLDRPGGFALGARLAAGGGSNAFTPLPASKGLAHPGELTIMIKRGSSLRGRSPCRVRRESTFGPCRAPAASPEPTRRRPRA